MTLLLYIFPIKVSHAFVICSMPTTFIDCFIFRHLLFLIDNNTKKVKYPCHRPTWPKGVQEVKAPRFHDTRHTKVVRSSPLRTGCLYPQEYPGIHFLEAESTPGTWTCRMLQKKIPSDTTGDRSRDLPTSSSALTTTLPQAFFRILNV